MLSMYEPIADSRFMVSISHMVKSYDFPRKHACMRPDGANAGCPPGLTNITSIRILFKLFKRTKFMLRLMH